MLDKCAKNNFIQNPKIVTNFICANDSYGVKLVDRVCNNQIIKNYIGVSYNLKSAKNSLGPTNKNIIKNNITDNGTDINYAFYFYENNDQSGVINYEYSIFYKLVRQEIFIIYSRYF